GLGPFSVGPGDAGGGSGFGIAGSPSYAPMLHRSPRRAMPRWSMSLTGGAAQAVGSPVSSAALPAPSAIVCVGPPLLASGPSFGSASTSNFGDPVVKPQVVVGLNSRLYPPSVMMPAQLPGVPLVSLARMVLVARTCVPEFVSAPP